MSTNVCVDRGAGAAAAAAGSGRTLLDFFKPTSATDGTKESPVQRHGRREGVAGVDGQW